MSRRLAVWIFLVILLVALVAIAAAGPGGASGVSEPLRSAGSTYPGRVLQSGSSDVRVATVPLTGPLVNGISPTDGGTGGEDVVRMLDAIRNDEESWDGVILELDTPGGSVLASEEIVDALRRLEDETDIPVVSWMRGVAASAGYYVAAPTDRIVASPNTFTGSIGVILEYYVVDELADKVGVEAVTIKSGDLKDLGNPLREPTEEERELFQAIIDEAYDQFVEVVADGRDMPESRVRELADGRIYTGRQAKELDLVDELGLRAEVYDAVADLVDQKGVEGDDLDVVEFSRQYSPLDRLLSGTGSTLDSLRAAGDVARALTGDDGAARRLAGETAAPASGGDVRDGSFARLEYRAVLG